MNSPTSDAELAEVLRRAASACHLSPMALLKLGEAAAEHQRWACIPNFPPFPEVTNEETLTEDHLAAWPDWSRDLVGPGARLAALVWPDGTRTVRLLSPRGLVLAASTNHPSPAKQ